MWWRDDDGIRDTPALRWLVDLAKETEVHLALAVIPRDMEPSLARLVEGAPGVTVLQHGFGHVNHAPAGAKKTELVGGRRQGETVAELVLGRRRLADMFGGRFLPALVPPWNRIDPSLIPALPEAGFSALSMFARRPRAMPATGLRQTNCHVDPVDWRGGRRFPGTERALGQVLAHLAARRLGDADGDEPTGLLSHHWAHDRQGRSFLRRFLTRARSHPAARWLRTREALWPAP